MPPTTAPKKAAPANAAKPAKKSARASQDDDLEEWKKSRQLLKPKDQLELGDMELKEVLPRILQITNVHQPYSLVQFDFASGEFIPIPSPGNCVVVFNQHGTFLHKDTDEARKQYITQDIDPAELGASGSAQTSVISVVQKEKAGDAETVEGGEDEAEKGEEKEGEEQGASEGKAEDVEQGPRPTPRKKWTNQFNFCEPAALPYNNPYKTRDTQTIPLPKATYSANVLQWIIYDDS